MARRRFDSWHSANRYPWESYEEAKKRYENQYGSIQEDEVDTSWAEEYKREQGLAQEEEEDEGGEEEEEDEEDQAPVLGALLETNFVSVGCDPRTKLFQNTS